MRRVVILDTSMLCVHLQVHQKDTCGPAHEQWDYKRISEYLHAERELNTTLVLPLAAIIETGNHIAQAGARRFETAERLAEIMRAAADIQSPWAAFAEQLALWGDDALRSLAEDLPEMCAREIGMGDMSIKLVADYYDASGNWVEILTGDEGLRRYAAEPPRHLPVPRRRSGPHASSEAAPPAPRRRARR